MKFATSRVGAGEKGGWPFFTLVVTAMLFMPGCAPLTAQPKNRGQPAESQTPYALPPQAKIALSQGQFKDPVELTHAGSGSPFPERKIVDKFSCDKVNISGPNLSAGMGLWLVYLGAVGVSYAAHCIGDPPVQQEEPEPKRLTILKDVPAEHKAEYTLGTRQRDLAERAFEKSIVGLHPLPDRVRRYARERGLGELAEPPAQASKSPPDERKGHEMPDYVIELGIAAVELHPTDSGDFYWFGFVARGRLVRAKDKLVVQAFETAANTNAYPWTPKDVKGLSGELDFALNTLAKTIVDEWLEPALKGSR